MTIFTANPGYNAVSPQVIIGLGVVTVLFNILEGLLDLVFPPQRLREDGEEPI